jgi:coproporphyrinogen III oxidase-like Fe-S oxidoreductase
VQLYAHFAFCQSSCRFCQYFHVVPRDHEQTTPYTSYLVGLLRRYGEALGRVEVSNAYFGGGTPSALPAAQLDRFLTAFEQTFHVRREFTCEAHPGNLDEKKLYLLRRTGVNRLSMGLQSFDPAVLKRIGRINPPLERVAELVRCARRLGMWVNTDLVLGLPGQTPSSFVADLDQLMSQGRPDCLTVYRYQPVPGLPDVPPDGMRYSRVLTSSLILRALRTGYLPATTGGDDRPGKDFFRNTTRTWRQWLERIRYEVVRMVRSDGELPVYALFENNNSHLLGLGPGSMSHIYGHSWYREATAVAHASATTEPVYLGTRLTPADECRSTFLQAFAESRWVDQYDLTRRSGVDIDAVFGELLDDGVRQGALQRVGRWYRRARGASAATHTDFFEALLPSLSPDRLKRDQHAAEVAALRAQEDVQTELVAIGDHLGDGAPEQDGGNQSRRSDAALLAWARLIGLGAPGQKFSNAIIDRIGGGGEAHFRVLPEPAPTLRVIVELENGQPSFLRAGPYSISYAKRDDSALAPPEEQFLLELCARTTQALGSEATPPLFPTSGAET